MNDRVRAMISEWAHDCVRELYRSEYAGINAVERLLRDPGICYRPEHRVLWWPKTRRIAKVSRAAHLLTPIERIVLIIHYKALLDEAGRVFTKADLVKSSSLTPSRYDVIRRGAERALFARLG